MFRYALILILTVPFLGGVPPAPEAPGRGRAGWTVESVQELMEAMDVAHHRLEERWTKWFATKY